MSVYEQILINRLSDSHRLIITEYDILPFIRFFKECISIRKEKDFKRTLQKTVKISL